MTDIPQQIARLHCEEFFTAAQEHADDRDALVALKDALEVEMAFAKDKPHIHGFYVRKMIFLDGLLRRHKKVKKNPQQQTNSQTALIVVLAWTDEEGEKLEEQFATMQNLSDFMAKTWSTFESDSPPRVQSYWQCHHLQFIPDHIWDETKPEWLAPGFVPEPTDPNQIKLEALHEAFSR